MTPQTKQYLTTEGWKNYKQGDSEIWCRQWKDAPSCRCNSDKQGIQVTVTDHHLFEHSSYEIDVTGEKPDGQWVRLAVYGIREDELVSVLYQQANQLVAAWTLLANQQPNKQ